MKYRYETHLHTSEASACGFSSGAEMARAHKEKGYAGIFITDHFLNGNSAIPKNLPWAERIALFCKGYENAYDEGQKIGLQVFFGFEYAAGNAEFLIYNLNKQWLLDHPDIDLYPTRQALARMREGGAFIIQPHPFRERDYVDHIELYPRDVDGVEIINGAHIDCPKQNERSEIYAKMFDLPGTSGSDTHNKAKMFGCGVEVEEPFTCPLDYLKCLREGTLTLLQPKML